VSRSLFVEGFVRGVFPSTTRILLLELVGEIGEMGVNVVRPERLG